MFLKLVYEIIICFPFTNMWIINRISYRFICVYMIFYYLMQYGCSFLHISASQGNTDVCNFLISKGANINQVDEVSIVFHYSYITTYNIHMIYSFWQRCKTCYIMYSAWVKLTSSGGFMKARFFHEVYNRSQMSDRR